MHVFPLLPWTPTLAHQVTFCHSFILSLRQVVLEMLVTNFYQYVILHIFCYPAIINYHLSHFFSPYHLHTSLDNTFILALDGDVEFNYIGVQRLVEVSSMIPKGGTKDDLS